MENMKTKFREMKAAWEEIQREQEMKTDYRGRTKWVAYFHIFTFSTLLALLIMAVFAATFITPFMIGNEVPKGDDAMSADLQKLDEIPQGARTAFVSCMWFGVVAVGLGIIIQLMASLSLLNSIEMTMDPIKALEKARFWRNTTIVFAILDFFVLVIMFELYLAGGLIIFVRLSSLSDVSGFTKTLEKEAAKKQVSAETASPPEIVTKQ